jgi:hypothetical protein
MESVIKEQSVFDVNLSQNDILRKLSQNIDNRKWSKAVNSDPSIGLKYKIRTSFKSWGEIVFIKVSEITEKKSVIRITSKPLLFTTLLDYGKNRNNINYVKEILGVSY